jgi:putative flippase GtrA
MSFDKVKSFYSYLLIKYRQFIIYCFIGICGVFLDIALFIGFQHFCGLHYQFSNVLSSYICICNNYFWNAKYNFKVTNHHLLRLLSFISIGTIGLGISSLCLFIFCEIIGLYSWLAKLITIGIVTVLQFLLNKFFTFMPK